MSLAEDRAGASPSKFGQGEASDLLNRRSKMPNDTKTILATFDTREAADAAMEHLVQQQGVERPDIFVQARVGQTPLA